MGASNLNLMLIRSTWDCITFQSFNIKNEFQKLAGLWLAGEMVNRRIGIYGSKVAVGLSAFQRRPCIENVRIDPAGKGTLLSFFG